MFYPVANDTPAPTDKIAATNDGKHILGAAATPATLSDVFVTLPVTTACPTTVPPNYFGSSVTSQPLAGVTATAITGVEPASNSALAFVTYTGTSGLLPKYVPSAGAGPGTLSFVQLSSGATAPVAGVFSTDNLSFYVGTSGDNQVHVIKVTGTTAVDSSVIAPKLPDANGNIVVPNLLVQRPKKATS